MPWPHHQDVFKGVQQFLNERPGWTAVFDEHPGLGEVMGSAGVTRYDGVIARSTPRMHRRLAKAGVPLVNVHRESYQPGTAGVLLDGRAVGRLAAEHLIDRGFKRLCIMFDPQFKLPQVIKQGFVETVEAADCHCEVIDVPDTTDQETKPWLRLKGLLSDALSRLEPPMGLYIENTGTARRFIQLAVARGFKVPQDWAVLGNHDIRTSTVSHPQISTISFGYERVGYEAARLLERLMDGQAAPTEPILIPPAGVTARESTDYFAVEDALVAEALRYITAHLTAPMTVDAIAYELNVSTRLLQLRFAEELGVGISVEIRRLRLEKAKRLLAERDIPIGDIPQQVGYASATMLGRAFKKSYDMTPSAFRKDIQRRQALRDQ